MTPTGPESVARLCTKRAGLETRSRLLQALRGFFFDRGFLEVETPVRLRAPALEAHIDAEPAGDAFLRTSPELHMKRLVAAGHGAIFQIGPCFRHGERGELHHPEFTMLEWYRAPGDYRAILDDTLALLRHAGHALGRTVLERNGRRTDIEAPARVIPVSEAFICWAGWDPATGWDANRFDLDLIEKVEPALPTDAPVILIDYPAPAAALSRLKPDDPLRAERWELYLGGVEIANAYSELTDARLQRERFEACARERAARGGTVYPLDEAFLAALDAGLPACGGIALGVDRLAMLFAGVASLDEVIAFRE